MDKSKIAGGTQGKYVPPSMRDGGSKKGESMMSSRGRGELTSPLLCIRFSGGSGLKEYYVNMQRIRYCLYLPLELVHIYSCIIKISGEGIQF